MVGGRATMRFGFWSVAVMFGVFALTASVGSVALGSLTRGSAAALAVPPAGFEVDSTQAVCALTGEHGAYTERPADYTQNDYGLNSGDSGSSFEFDGNVWWLFGNTGATVHKPWGPQNAKTRWPGITEPLSNPAALGSDSIATSPAHTRPPAPAAPYNDTKMPPNQQCPVLSFVREPGPAGKAAYANPSVYPDPLFKKPYYLSLRKGELPEAGISEGHPAKMYVVFGTDNPANCASLAKHPGPCAEPAKTGTGTTCNGTQGSRTRSVMAVYIPGSGARFTGLYDLSKPSARYGPDCLTSPDAAKFVNVQLQNGPDGYVYIWGTEGGAHNDHSSVYLARTLASKIASQDGLEYWNGTSFVGGPQTKAAALFTDHPAACMAQLGIQYNPYLGEWIMLYHCKESPAPANHPNGIYMRTAPNPWGPWSSPTTIFDPDPDQNTESGYCYFIYSSQTFDTSNLDGSPKCPAGSPNATLADSKSHVGSYYGPYFVANWTTGTAGTTTQRASTTIYYTLDTYDPYGQLIMRSTILGAPVGVVPKPPLPHCKGTTCK
jgi:Domain of unknown function (DUF4185)